MAKLKACPFCGGDAESVCSYISGMSNRAYYVRCSYCNAFMGQDRRVVSFARGSEFFENEDDAIEAWNRRASDDTRTT